MFCDWIYNIEAFFESENFLIPPLHHILESENFRLPLSKENSVTCVVKYENQTSENLREFIREASKTVREWNVI